MYLDIFYNILIFNDDEILLTFDKYGNIWYCYNNLLKCLDYVNIDEAKNSLNVNSEYFSYYKDININTNKIIGLKSNTKMINQNGLFYILSISKKPKAKLFMEKYIKDIMPSITQTGKYISSKQDQYNINKINNKYDKLKNKIMNYKDENIYLNNKYDFIDSKNGYVYIYQSECFKNGEIIKCFKFGITNNMYNRHINYLIGKPTIKLLCYAILDTNIKQIELCIKSLTKNHAIKNKVETVKFNSLNELKKLFLIVII